MVVQDGKALIVKRAHEPRKGEWSLPGGRVELGESLVDAARREIKEETGLDVEVGALVEVFDRVHRLDGRVRYHFVIVDYLCTRDGGTLCAADDAEDVAWVGGERSSSATASTSTPPRSSARLRWPSGCLRARPHHRRTQRLRRLRGLDMVRRLPRLAT